MTDYRDRIYAKYSSGFQDAESVFDRDAAHCWGKGYAHYFRGWLPKDKNAAVLDIACGYGKLLHYFEERGYERVSGVDISPEQVKIALQVTPAVTEANVLDFLKVHPDEFDLITGLDIVEHFKKDEVLDFLELCQKSLKPGGRLILQTPNAGCPWGAEHRYNDFTHELGFNPNALTRLLKLCHFTSVQAREIGPMPRGYSWKSSVRYMIWQTIRTGIKVYNLAETGSVCSNVFSRVFLISALKT